MEEAIAGSCTCEWNYQHNVCTGVYDNCNTEGGWNQNPAFQSDCSNGSDGNCVNVTTGNTCECNVNAP